MMDEKTKEKTWKTVMDVYNIQLIILLMPFFSFPNKLSNPDVWDLDLSSKLSEYNLTLYNGKDEHNSKNKTLYCNKDELSFFY